VRDLDQIRTFLTGAGPVAIVDLPWIPVFLAICFLIHPWLGLVATVGGIVLFTMTLLTERSSRAPARLAAQEAGVRSVLIEAGRHGSETVVAMGMAGALAQRWGRGKHPVHQSCGPNERCGERACCCAYQIAEGLTAGAVKGK
jgi:ATP-binding cassette subfamily C protein PrsD